MTAIAPKENEEAVKTSTISSTKEPSSEVTTAVKRESKGKGKKSSSKEEGSSKPKKGKGKGKKGSSDKKKTSTTEGSGSKDSKKSENWDENWEGGEWDESEWWGEEEGKESKKKSEKSGTEKSKKKDKEWYTDDEWWYWEQEQKKKAKKEKAAAKDKEGSSEKKSEAKGSAKKDGSSSKKESTKDSTSKKDSKKDSTTKSSKKDSSGKPSKGEGKSKKDKASSYKSHSNPKYWTEWDFENHYYEKTWKYYDELKDNDKSIKLPEDGSKPEKPNRDEFDDKIYAVQVEIDAKRRKITELMDNVEKKSAGKDSYERERSDHLYKLKQIKEKRKGLLDERRALVAEGKAELEAKKENQRKIKEMEREASGANNHDQTEKERRKLGGINGLNEELIDKKISEAEYLLNVRTTQLTLLEEKRIMLEIKKLRALKPAAQKHMRELEALKAVNIEGTSALTDDKQNRDVQIKEIDQQLDEFNSEIKEVESSIDKLKEQRANQMKGVDKLITQRNQLRDEIAFELLLKKKKLENEKKKANKIWKLWEDQEKEKQRLAWEAERKQWEAQKEAEKAKKELEKPNPFLSQSTLLEQTLDYCRGLLGIGLDDGAKKMETEIATELDGAIVIATKKQRNEDGAFFEGTKGKKKALRAPREVDDHLGNDISMINGKKNKTIKHTADTLSIFAELHLPAPVTNSDVPDLMSRLERNLTLVNMKAAQWESERKAKLVAAEKKMASTIDTK